MRIAEFKCNGSRTRLIGLILRRGRRAVFFLPCRGDDGRWQLGSVLRGRFSKRGGFDVFSLDGSRTEFVGTLA